jgi:1,4-dihydroxy-2-naphthoate octaprenyltransferase
MAANMTNDWYDVKHGVDDNAPTTEYRPHPLLFGELEKEKYKMVILSLYGSGLIIGLYLTWLRGLPVLVFSCLGIFFGVFYTADPILLKHRSVGEISVFLAWGPLMVGGAFYALTGKLSIDSMIASIPIGLLVALVLLANNLRDKEFDASIGITTITTDRDVREGVLYYKAILASAYLSTIILIIVGTLSPFSILTLLSLKEAMRIINTFNQEVPQTSDQITAQLALRFGVLLIIGEFINIVSTTFL